MAGSGSASEKLNWSVFDGFERPSRTSSWSQLDEFLLRARRFAAERCRAFPGLLQMWDELLADLDGDPSKADWRGFRPLRIDREEGWSDWLQHLIATSISGRFGSLLFARNRFAEVRESARPHVVREDVTDDRRADLVIQWGNGVHTHLEVKVGDQSFAKTVETASKLESKYPAAAWTHYILLPLDDVERWGAIDRPEAPAIHTLTWDDVATALRRSLRRREEGRAWMTWAHGFCGLVEQKLLGHPLAGDVVESLNKMERRMHQISIMDRGLADV